jgi:ABC-type glycerol-3-phosphate transport system substrate-binding protein
MKRILSLLLAVLMAASLLLTAVSCGESADGPADTGKGSVAGSETEDETKTPYELLEKENYDRSFTVLIRNDCTEDFVVDSMTGYLLADSIYERNTVVSEDYGVDFSFVYSGYDYNGINDAVKKQVSGGQSDYQMFIGHKYSYGTLAMNNYLQDLGKVDTLSLSEAWWDQACYENLTVAGKTYVMTGDINPSSSMRISSCMVFNKDLMTELGKSPAALNELTENGEWTLDTLLSYCQDVSFDSSGDGKLTYDKDRYCLTGWMMAAPYALYYGCNGNFVSVVDGEPQLTYTDEKVTGIYEKIFDIIVTQKAYYVTSEPQYATMFDVFSEGRALFSVLTLKLISQYLSDMEDSYGILPIPKYDTYQKEYMSFVNGSTGLVMVAKNTEDVDFVGAVMDGMAAYNYSHVTPNMFQVVTKLQVAQDPESARMVDLVIRNRVFDMGYFADLTVTNLVKSNLGAGKREIAAGLKSGRSGAKKALERMLANMDKFD